MVRIFSLFLVVLIFSIFLIGAFGMHTNGHSAEMGSGCIADRLQGTTCANVASLVGIANYHAQALKSLATFIFAGTLLLLVVLSVVFAASAFKKLLCVVRPLVFVRAGNERSALSVEDILHAWLARFEHSPTLT